MAHTPWPPSLMDCGCGWNGRSRPPRAAIRRQNGRLALGTHLCVSEEHLAPRGGLAPALEHPAVDERPPVEIVVHVACEDEAVDERRVKEQLLKPLQRPEPDEIAPTHAHEIFADVESPVLVRGVEV